MTKSNKLWIVFGALCIVIIGLIAYGYSTISQKNNQIFALTTDNNSFSLKNSQLESELAGVKASLDTNTQAFTAHKELLKQYVSYTKVISQDVQAVTAADKAYYDEKSTDYDTNKILVNRYEQQINIFKKHVAEYNALLANNTAAFKEIGIDTEVEITTVENSMPLYDDELEKMNNYLDTIKK
jgi:hypothetical protein